MKTVKSPSRLCSSNRVATLFFKCITSHMAQVANQLLTTKTFKMDECGKSMLHCVERVICKLNMSKRVF